MTKIPAGLVSSWLIKDINATHLNFSGNPDNTLSGNFTVTITVDDGHNRTANPSFSFEVCIYINQLPSLVQTPPAIPNVTVGFNSTYQFQKAWVADPDGDPVAFSVEVTPSNGWMVVTDYPTFVELRVAPTLNSQARAYTAKFKFTDGYEESSHSAGFNVLANLPPIAGYVPPEVEVMAPMGKDWSFGAGLFTDPEGLPLAKGVKVNGSSTLPSWLVCDSSVFAFAVTSTSNSISGTYNITVSADDGFNAPVQKSFLFKIVYVSTRQVRGIGSPIMLLHIRGASYG